jgi:spore maturation protein CgeB
LGGQREFHPAITALGDRMKIIYSFNKVGLEADLWEREIAGASSARIKLIPFNHQKYLDPNRYLRAQSLDNLYYERNPGLSQMYADIQEQLRIHDAKALLVDTCPPYHPEFLRGLSIYKILRVADGPISAYDRDFAYLHAYDHVLYHSPAYSRDLTMAEKLQYCGARRHDLWPLWLFESAHDARRDEASVMSGARPIDVAFVGALHVGKMAELARIKRHFGSRCAMYGLANLKRNVYFNLKYGMPGWIRPIRMDEYVSLYQRAKIGFNIHNRGKYTVGNFRMFELPANGVMQVSDGSEYLGHFFGRDAIVGADEVDAMIERIEYFLDHEQERREVALQGYRTALGRHRFAHRVEQLADMLDAARV